ncbi:E3 ubiquitin-protein ligase EL5-like [Oryza brachyantha]|uniref:E3 ubiquitin-protein ligase EL5-like n=1 Tax=Oryza brachyantha TaxID=4533 RepID=UPI001ADB6BC0|nr:E3 ubiquitin-protein ligase EL5-like [Oryza brachyantha]
MALWPPPLPLPFAQPPPRQLLSPPPPWWPPASTTPSRGNDSTSSPGGIVASVAIGLVALLLAFAITCTICQGRRNSRAAAADARLRPPPNGDDADGDNGEPHQLRRSGAASPSAPPWPGDDDGATNSASPTAASLPAFTYSPTVKRNVAGDEGEQETAAAAATCSVCLGALRLGETVRLLPACLHLYHAECIDPWLDGHTTCPLCRSDADADPTAAV